MTNSQAYAYKYSVFVATQLLLGRSRVILCLVADGLLSSSIVKGKRSFVMMKKVKKKHQLVIVAAMETEQSTITTCRFLLSPTANKPKMLRFQGQELLPITKYFAILRFTSTLSWSCLDSKPL